MRRSFVHLLIATFAMGFVAGSSGATEPWGFEVESIRNLAYFDGDGADSVRHKLDIHRPRDCKDFPVLFFVHGGGWVQGNKDHFGIYSMLGRTLARQGIGVVCPNYRLSPQVKHPEHIRDVAKAFAWTMKNIGKYGGNPKEMFVGGHSAGGHLSALLATDESYLKAEGLSFASIKGALPVSGVFTVPPMKMFDPVFGKDLAGRKQASPITYASSQSPPFLIFFGDNDLPSCDRPGAEAFCKALTEHQCSARICEIAPRNHMSILINAVKETDPLTRGMLSFIESQVVADRFAAGDVSGGIDELGEYVARYAATVAKK